MLAAHAHGIQLARVPSEATLQVSHHRTRPATHHLDISALSSFLLLTVLLPAGKEVDEPIDFLQRSRQNPPVRENNTPLRAAICPVPHQTHTRQGFVAREPNLVVTHVGGLLLAR